MLRSERVQQVEQEATPEDEFSGLLCMLSRLHPRYTHDRVTAAERIAAESLSEQQLLEAERLLISILTGKRKETRLFAVLRGLAIGAGVGATLGLAGIILIAAFLDVTPDAGLLDIALSFLAFCLAGALILSPLTVPYRLFSETRANDEVRSACLAALARLCGRRVLPELAERLRDRSAVLRVTAVEAIIELLPVLDANIPLTAAETMGVAHTLPHVTLTEALLALDLIEICGSSAAAEWIREFAARTESEELAKRALRVAETLDARREEDRHRETLLRPSAGHEEQTLLRSSRSVAESDPALLLREASASESSDER